MSLHNFLLFHFRSHIKNSCFVFHQGFLRPRAFITFSVFGTPDETLALVFDILHLPLKETCLISKTLDLFGSNEVTVLLIVIKEWSVLKPANISEFVTLQVRLWLTRKKSNRQWISGFWRHQVYLRPSGFESRHTSTKSNSAIWSLITLTALVCVLARPPFLSMSISNTISYNDVIALKISEVIVESFKKTWIVFIWSIYCS